MYIFTSYIFIYVCILICINTYLYVCVYMHKYIHICIYFPVYIYFFFIVGLLLNSNGIKQIFPDLWWDCILIS